MTATIEKTYVQAAANKRMVELVDSAGQARIVEPYMVYLSSSGERHFHCYQLGGFSQSQSDEPRGWRNPRVSEFVEARELFATFKPRPDYNPENHKLFPAVIFAVPKPADETSAT